MCTVPPSFVYLSAFAFLSVVFIVFCLAFVLFLRLGNFSSSAFVLNAFLLRMCVYFLPLLLISLSFSGELLVVLVISFD